MQERYSTFYETRFDKNKKPERGTDGKKSLISRRPSFYCLTTFRILNNLQLWANNAISAQTRMENNSYDFRNLRSLKQKKPSKIPFLHFFLRIQNQMEYSGPRLPNQKPQVMNNQT
jgi:hypothetical protein